MGVIEAIQKGDGEALGRELASNPAAANARTENGVPAVLMAMYYRQPEMARRLLDAGAAVDLHIAATMGLAEAAASILESDPGALGAKSADGWTALHLAAFFGQPAMVRTLLSRGADALARSENQMANLALHAAAAARQTEIVELLLDAGTPVDARQHGGFTAAHSAAQGKDLATLEVLRARGADMNAQSDDGKTPAGLLEA
ncbi:MAG: ankyrin repeat domain-containing protein [Acidobacteria bacterium]|nr:ankyrin repeat domain-containing protein [Acidobacteriota bacterium]